MVDAGLEFVGNWTRPLSRQTPKPRSQASSVQSPVPDFSRISSVFDNAMLDPSPPFGRWRTRRGEAADADAERRPLADNS